MQNKPKNADVSDKPSKLDPRNCAWDTGGGRESRWRHQMETFSALLALCAGNSPVTGEFSAQRPLTRSFDDFFDLRPNKRFSKQSWSWRFETPLLSLWRHWNDSTYWLRFGIFLFQSDTMTSVTNIGVCPRCNVQRLCNQLTHRCVSLLDHHCFMWWIWFLFQSSSLVTNCSMFLSR